MPMVGLSIIEGRDGFSANMPSDTGTGDLTPRLMGLDYYYNVYN